jgi:hypothetical protein
VLIDAPKFDVNESIKYFGTIVNAYVLMVQDQVDMAVSRFFSFFLEEKLMFSGVF